MSLRWDKFIWSVRIAKTRSQATELLQKGRILINGLQVKPAREPKVGDEITVHRNSAVFSYKVLALNDKRVGAKLVENIIVDTTNPEEIEKFKQYQLAQSAYRSYGTGKPSKKDRRDMDVFLDHWE
jgi:ribosome-associated heat shock protein Hsp15